MPNSLLSDLACITKGQLIGQDRAFTQICIDTRTLQPGDIFLALKGVRFDGHDYIARALEKGAGGVIAANLPEDFTGTAIVVADPIKALGRFARYWQSQFSIPTAVITGSFGKTTVKAMVTHILGQSKKVLSAKANFNNEIGVPLTLLRLDPTYDIAVIEMGACALGDIRYLMSLVEPTVSLVVGTFEQHLEKFGTLENIIQEKGEVYRGLDPKATAVLPVDANGFETWQARLPLIQKRITFGLEKPADIFAENIVLAPMTSCFTLQTPQASVAITLPVPGRHNVYNALAACAVAQVLGGSLENVKTGLETFPGGQQRLESKVGACGACILDDTYNAGLLSMKAAVSVLSRFKGQKIFVMGEMGEMGEQARVHHQTIGTYAREKGIDHLFGTGGLVAETVKAFGPAGQWYEKKADLIKALQSTILPEDTILIKGSRFTKMEEVVQALC